MFNSTEPSRGSLVDTLNDLLDALYIQLPMSLESPYDLTPSLLLAILESILCSRLPISSEVRASRDLTSKVQAMKIFLGVLEADVIRADVGLSDVDPRKLAAGDEEEVVFAGELLCWVGRQAGFLPGTSGQGSEPPCWTRNRARSPSNHSHSRSTFASSTESNLSMMRTGLADTDTSVLSTLGPDLQPLASLNLNDTASPLHIQDLMPVRASTPYTPEASPPGQPRCIHEVDDRSFLTTLGISPDAQHDDESYCHCAESRDRVSRGPGPRGSGAFARVQHRAPSTLSASASLPRRVQSYSTSRLTQSTNSAPVRRVSQGSGRILTPHNAPPTQYTLALLTERAKLFSELSDSKSSRRSSLSSPRDAI